MRSLIVTPKNEKEFEFLTSLLKKLGYGTMVIYDEDKEDLGLLKAMLEEKKGDYVSEDDVNRLLREK